MVFGLRLTSQFLEEETWVSSHELTGPQEAPLPTRGRLMQGGRLVLESGKLWHMMYAFLLLLNSGFIEILFTYIKFATFKVNFVFRAVLRSQ